MNTIGHNIKITFFGESHGPSIGVVIDHLPAGVRLDMDLIRFNLSKRRPKKGISTTRVEMDEFRILSGYLNDRTTGAALTIVIDNKDTLSGDYKNLVTVPRPSHADYPAYVKYQGFNDYRGGGFFSGRLTALWVIVGSIAEQLLKVHGVTVGSHILKLKDLHDVPFDPNHDGKDVLNLLNQSSFPLLDASLEQPMLELIAKTKKSLDSVGGMIESKVIGLPIGLGEPYFLSVESYVSSLLFSVPAVKAVEFGAGVDFANMNGSEANDPYEMQNEHVTTTTNHNGGILGGLTTGRPVILKTTIKPTSSIAKPQKSVDLEKMENTSLIVKGRHDPQIVSRAVHVVNAVLNFAFLDFILF